MLLYEIKLMLKDSREIVYYKLEKKPMLPSQEIVNSFPDSELIINTVDSASLEQNSESIIEIKKKAA